MNNGQERTTHVSVYEPGRVQHLCSFAPVDHWEAIECSAKWTAFHNHSRKMRASGGLSDNVLRMLIMQCCSDYRAALRWGRANACGEPEVRAMEGDVNAAVESRQTTGTERRLLSALERRVQRLEDLFQHWQARLQRREMDLPLRPRRQE